MGKEEHETIVQSVAEDVWGRHTKTIKPVPATQTILILHETTYDKGTMTTRSVSVPKDLLAEFVAKGGLSLHEICMGAVRNAVKTVGSKGSS